jgi:amidase
MKSEEYRHHDAVGLAALISRGEVSAAEVLTAAIAAADAVDPELGAIVLRMDGEAWDRVRTPLTGPLAGVPFLIKDMNHDYAGLPTAAGSRALSDVPAVEHAEVVRRWLSAGLVIFGKTSTPELGAKAVTEPRAFGPTRNPWNLGHTPGAVPRVERRLRWPPGSSRPPVPAMGAARSGFRPPAAGWWD